MVRLFGIFFAALSLCGCGTGETAVDTDVQPAPSVTTAPTNETSQAQSSDMLKITVDEHTFYAVFEDNPSADAFRQLLEEEPITVEMEDYGGFEKVGSLGTSLPRTDTHITTVPGDIILYQGNQITIYYDTNTWNFTKLAQIEDPESLKEKLGEGSIRATFSLE